MIGGDFLAVEGSLLEGGGQILRNAVALAAITRKPVYVDRIRAGAATPAAAEAEHAAGSELQQHPQSSRAAQQAAAPSAAAAELTTSPEWAVTVSTVVLKGGTDAAFAPPIGYLQYVLLPSLRRLLLLLDSGHLPNTGSSPGLTLTLKRRGFYPKGGGEAVLQVPALARGASLPSFTLTERGRLQRIDCRVYTAGKFRSDFGQKIANAASATLKKVLKDLNTSTGCLFGSSALVERGCSAEEVGVPAATSLIEELVSGAAVDQ
eukprot:gene11171-11321_t